MFPIHLQFHGDLRGFLHSAARDARQAADCYPDGYTIHREIRGKTAVKDAIEVCGVPHTEVDLIAISRDSEAYQVVDFSWAVEAPARIDVYPAPASADLLRGAPRLQAHRWTRFVADGHLGKLARSLRLLGFDTAYERDADDRRLVELMLTEDRALLTRDRPLLMRSVVRHGYCPRSADPEEQTREVLRRFSPGPLALFSRCLACNAPLQPVAKSEVLGALADQPLTLRHFDAFHRCVACRRIFWRGSHFDKLAARIARVTGDETPPD
jgi:uncharacterized protein